MYSLYLITDDMYIKNLSNSIDLAIQGGVTMVQLRMKNITTRDFYELAKEIKIVTSKHKIPLIINDRLDVAMAINADGIHLGQSDLPIHIAKQLWSKDKIFGATTKTMEQALAAEQAGANYLGIGALFPTTTKVITQPTKLETIQEIASTVKIPVVAIGGINYENVNILKGTNISGISIVSGILAQKDIKTAATNLKSAIHTIRSEYKK